jgi:hypothetical protein
MKVAEAIQRKVVDKALLPKFAQVPAIRTLSTRSGADTQRGTYARDWCSVPTARLLRARWRMVSRTVECEDERFESKDVCWRGSLVAKTEQTRP